MGAPNKLKQPPPDTKIGTCKDTTHTHTKELHPSRGDNVQVRLDRATCTDIFLEMFPETHVEHLVTEESDHEAILVRALETAPRSAERGPRPFQFEEAWTRHEQYETMVSEAWREAGSGEHTLEAIWNRLGKMTGSMQKWAREVFGSIRRQIAKLKSQLADARLRAVTTGCSLEVRDIEQQLREIYAREELLYRQRF